MALKHIKSRYSFIRPLNESIKTAKEYLFRVNRESILSQYKQKLTQSIEAGTFSLGQDAPEEQVRKIESGEIDRELEKMLLQDQFAIPIDPNLNALFEKIKANRTFGPNVLALPITKMYLRYPEQEHQANLINLLDSLDNVKLRDFLKSRAIDAGKLISDFVEAEEEGGRTTYEMLGDYLTSLEVEIRANWLIKELKTDAAMGPERILPPFNQVEAFRQLAPNDPIRKRIIACADEFSQNRSNPVVAAAIAAVKNKIASKGSMKDLVEWLERTLDNALNASDNMSEFIKAALTVGNLVDIVYQDESAVVTVVHHEIALATLFPMAQWCILPLGWGGGRGMWNTYIGGSHTRIQFAVMNFGVPASSNFRCWAFTYDVNQNKITHAHAKDDASFMSNIDTNGLDDIFTEKSQIGNYENSSTFTIPPPDLQELKDNLKGLYEKTTKLDSMPKLRTKSGASINDFSTSEMFLPGGLIREFIGHALRSAAAKAKGETLPSYISQHKAQLDIIISYLAADIYSSNYKNNIKENKPTLADTFINPFLKPTAGSKIPFIASGSEFATYLVAVMKASMKFTNEKVMVILKNLNQYIKLLIRDKARPFNRYQIEEALGAIKAYLKSMGTESITIAETEKGVNMIAFEDAEQIIKYIDNL